MLKSARAQTRRHLFSTGGTATMIGNLVSMVVYWGVFALLVWGVIALV